MTDGIRNFFFSNPPLPGNVDILCLGADAARGAAAVAAFLLGVALEGAGRPLYPRVYLLTVQSSSLQTTIRAYCLEELSKLFADADANPDAINQMLKTRLHFRFATSLEFNTILDTLNEAPNETAVIVVNAAYYRPSRPVKQDEANSGHTTAFGETIRTIIDENEWCSALAKLADLLEATVEKKRLYVPLLTGKFSPVLEENMRKLQGIKGGVLGGRPTIDIEGHVLQQATRWQEMISGGMEDAVFKEIDALELSELNRALAKAQCLFTVGRSFEGYELFRPFLDELRRNGSPGVQVNVARMAIHAGDHAGSLALLDTALAADPMDEPVLRAIHQHALTLRAEPQREKALELLRQRFPRHTYTLSVEIDTCLQRRQYTRIVELLGSYDDQANTPEYFRYALALAKGLGGSTPWPYHSVVEAVDVVAPEFATNAIIHCAQHALSSGEIDVALRFLLMDRTWDETGARSATRLIIGAIEKWALSMPSQQDPVEDRQKHEHAFQTMCSAIPFVLHYLAEHPEDVDIRVDLTNALAPESMGSLGFGILVHLLKSAEPETFQEVAEQEPEPPDEATGDQYIDFFRRYFERWDGRPLIGAPEPIHPEFQGEPLESLKRAAISCSQYLASTVDADPTDKQNLFMHVRIALDLLQHLGKESQIFELLRAVAAARANVGEFQDARDLAENALLLLGGRRSAVQKRAAWLVFGDVYARCGNLAEAILGWLCAAEHRDLQLTPSRIVQDMLFHVRLLRDTGLLSEAFTQLRRAREILERSSLDPVIRHRLEHLEATILLGRRSNTNELTVEAEEEELDRLADLVLRPLVSALDKNDDLFPPATLVAQVIALHEQRGRPVPDALRGSFNQALSAVPPDQSDRLRLLSCAAPGREDLLTLCHTLKHTRFSGDVDMDLRYGRLLARRSLDNLVRGADAECALLAIEFLAPHAVTPCSTGTTVEARRRDGVLEELRASTAARVFDTTDERERAAQARLLVQLNDPDGPRESTTIARVVDDPKLLNETVKMLGLANIDVHALALNSRGRLIRVSSCAGRLLAPVEEAPSIFDLTKLKQWRKEHPFCYCAPEGNKDRRGTISYLEESLAGIGTTAESPSGVSLYVVDHNLTDLPVNLIRMNDGLAGCLGAIASVPSLTWLHATLQEPRTPTGRRTAWFLPPSETLLFPPLAVLRDNLGEELARRDFTVVTDVELPSTHRGGDLAIVGAHGSIWFDKRIFRAVSDEAKLVRHSMSDFALRLSGTAVVVLLVCSGGRLDRDVLSFGATGLPYELLRRGCRAVVGSPWPLEVGLANRWAQHFVESWDLGATVVEAVRHANEDLRQLRPHESHSLAMSVIGNPLECSPR